LQNILEDKQPNDPLIFGCFNNSMPVNVKYVIKVSGITTLDEAMGKAYEMEENMLETNVDLELILAKVHRQMTSLSVNPQRALVSRNGSSLGTRRELFFGDPTNIRNTPYVSQFKGMKR
jgi:hypothetical protein